MNKEEITAFKKLVVENESLKAQLKENANQVVQFANEIEALKSNNPLLDLSFASNESILRLALQGGKIHQIKLVRVLTGMGLKESKDYVDSIHPPKPKEQF